MRAPCVTSSDDPLSDGILVSDWSLRPEALDYVD